MKNYDGLSVDIYDSENGDLDMIEEDFSNYEIEDFYGNDDYMIIGIDKGNHFCIYALDDDYSWYTQGIDGYQELIAGAWLLKWKYSENAYDIASINNADTMVYSGLYVDDEHQPYIDDYDYDTVYFWIQRENQLIKVKTSLSEGRDGDYEEVYEDDMETEDEEEYAMTEQKNNFINQFKILTEKLNNIHKRNKIINLD